MLDYAVLLVHEGNAAGNVEAHMKMQLLQAELAL